MKSSRLILLTLILSGVTACSPTVSQSRYDQHQPVSVEVFYSSLGPYGRWMDYPPYGYVWLPTVGIEFTPYMTNGYWVYTRFGWTWYSHYAWGWAPFHYGRWQFDPLYGWMWLPDVVWGPAWVAWRQGGGYCGWAPLGFGMSVQIVLGGSHPIPHDRWVFVREDHFPVRDIQRYQVDRARNNEFLRSTQVQSRVREERGAQYMPGPEAADIERATRRRLNEVAVEDRSDPGPTRLNNDRLRIYRPEVRKEREGEPKPVPPTVYRRDEVAPDGRVRTRPDGTRQPETNRPRDSRTVPDGQREPELSRQPQPEQQRRPSRSTGVKKRPTDEGETQKRSDRRGRD